MSVLGASAELKGIFSNGDSALSLLDDAGSILAVGGRGGGERGVLAKMVRFLPSTS